MIFPSDLSLWQMKEILHDIFEEYNPEIFTSDFIDELGEQEVNILLKFITSKDQEEFENTKSILEKYITDGRHDLDKILQESHSMFLNWQEKQSKDDDDNDLISLENELENMY